MGVSADNGITRGDEEFSNVRALGEPYGRIAAESLRDAYDQLSVSGAHYAAERLLLLDAAASDLDPPSLSKLISSDSALDAVQAKSQNRVHLLSTARTAAALVSGIFTLFVFAAAGIAYQNLLATHPQMFGQPFLQLWARGFNGQFGLRLPDLLFIDAALLTLVLAFTFLIYRTKRSQLVLKVHLSRRLDLAVSALTLAIARSRVGSPASAEEWVDASRRVTVDAMEQTRSLAEVTRRVTADAMEQTRGLAEVNSQASEAIMEASTALVDVQAQTSRVIEKLSRELTELTTEAREQNKEIMRRTAQNSTAMVQSLIERQIEPILDQLCHVLTEFGAMREVVERFISGLPNENPAEQRALAPPMLAELQHSQAALLRSQQELHDEVGALINRLRSTKVPEAAAASEPEVSAVPPMLLTSRSRRPLWQAFTDGLGGIFDLFGGIEHTRVSVPTFEEIAADDAHSLCLALGLVPGEENGTGEGRGQ